MKDSRDVWVFIEQAEGEIAPVSLELVTKARELADKLDSRVGALLCGQGVMELAQVPIQQRRRLQTQARKDPAMHHAVCIRR